MSPTPMTDAELTAIEAHSSTAIEARLLLEVRRLRALVATLRELLEEREWDFEEDRGYECNSCRSCGVTLRHGQPRKHKSGCQLDATLREPPP